MPAEQGRFRLGAEEGRQFLIGGDLGVAGGQLVVRPFDGVVLGN